MQLNNNTILITGGTSGIGLELGKTLKELNNHVILMGRNTQALNNLRADGFSTICCDLANQQEIEQAVLTIQNSYPQLNVLFNNAGIQNNYLFTDAVIPLGKIKHEIDVNITGQLTLTYLLLPTLMTNKNAYIINTTSGLSYFPKRDGITYSATKAAMSSFTIGLRNALRDAGIGVMEFIPPVTDTAMTSGRAGNKMSPEALVAHILPQMRKDRNTLTVRQIIMFRFIAHYFPGIADKIVSK